MKWLSLALCMFTLSLNAATYYVATTGSDTNSGTALSPFLTIQKGVNSCYGGDTVLVGAGTYDETVTTPRNATNSPIVIDGQGVATVKQVYFSKTNIHLQNFTLTGVTNTSSREIWIDHDAHYCVISNNIIDMADAPVVYGIQWNPSTTLPFGTGDASSHVTIISNTIQHCGGYVMISMFGDNNLVYGNLLRDSEQSDCFNVFGRSNSFIANVCSNFPINTNLSNHPDFIQTFGTQGQGCSNVLVEYNVIIGVTNGGSTEIAVSQLTASTTTNTGNFTFRNNLYVNMGLAASCSIPDVKYYNNTFVRCDFYNGGTVLSWSSNYFGSGTGYGGATGADLANGGQCFNNVFFQCGDGRPLTGWYYFSSELTNVAADYNFVCNTNYTAFNTNTLHRMIGDPAGWNNFQWWEDHGTNGGNPSFVSEAGANYRVPTNSILASAGTNLTALFTKDLDGLTRPPSGGWTIGAYEANGGLSAPLNFIILGTSIPGKSSL